MSTNIYNPYNQKVVPYFGKNIEFPADITEKYITERANLIGALDPGSSYPPTRLPNTTIIKPGMSKNLPPVQPIITPEQPMYSTSTHALIKTDRVGEQVGQADPYIDTAYKDWTYGIQYYTPFVGKNLKQFVEPIMAPPAYCPEIWAQNHTTFQQINRENFRDTSYLDLSYKCKNKCDIPSASLGTPIDRDSRIDGPLAVQYIGQQPNIGQYTAREIGRTTRDTPLMNPIITLQRWKAGLSAPAIYKEYDGKFKDMITSGFNYN